MSDLHDHHDRSSSGSQPTTHGHHAHSEENHAGSDGSVSVVGRLKEFFHFHDHDLSAASLDQALATDQGIRTVKISLAALLMTGIFQLIIVAASGSVALLADTIHNFSDALTAIPLWFAFSLSRKPRNQRFTYGFGRAEDLAGALIVLMILASAGIVIYESIQKIIHPIPVTGLIWVAIAAVIGFLGNEIVALYRIRVGRRIGSAALVSDGMHARTDGITSLGVLAGAIGAWLGFPLADPIVGLLIGATIIVIAWRSAQEMWYRMMDATDPGVVDRVRSIAAGVNGVLEVGQIRFRWLGHQQLSELSIIVDCQLSTSTSHDIAEEVRHRLLHDFPNLIEVIIHVNPCVCDRYQPPESTRAHPTPIVVDEP